MPLAVPVLLAVRALLRVLQAQLVAHLEGLPHCPDDPHGLALRGEKETWAKDAGTLGKDTGGSGSEQDVQGAGGQQLGHPRREAKPKVLGRAHTQGSAARPSLGPSRQHTGRLRPSAVGQRKGRANTPLRLSNTSASSKVEKGWSTLSGTLC